MNLESRCKSKLQEESPWVSSMVVGSWSVGEGVKSARGETAISWLHLRLTRNVFGTPPSHSYCKQTIALENSRKNAIVLRPLRAIASHELLHELLRRAKNYCSDTRCGIHPFSELPSCALRNVPVTPTPSIFPKVLPYKWGAYCRTNGRRTAVQMGGVLQGFPFFEA